MNLVEQFVFLHFTLHRPSPQQLVIHRHPGLLLSMLLLIYCGFVVTLNAIFIEIFLAIRSPRTLTCRSHHPTVNCVYEIRGRGNIHGETIQIKDVKKAIVSQKPSGERIVLTSSQPWIALEVTDNDTQNSQRINQALAQLHSSDREWHLDLYPPPGQWLGLAIFFSPIGLLFLVAGVFLLLSYCPASFELDAERNTITITKLGLLRWHPAPFDQLTAASEDPIRTRTCRNQHYIINQQNYIRYYILRLSFADRRPLTLTTLPNSHNQRRQLVDSINAFIAEHKA